MRVAAPFSVAVLLCTLFSSFSLYSRAGSNLPDAADAAMEEDSLVSVIAWFGGRDTMTYWINEGSWTFEGEDTVKTMGVNMKVMINVTDSTEDGYAMEYRFLEFGADTAVKAGMPEIVGMAVDRLNGMIAGKAIKFRTDEVGQITGYGNLKAIGRQAKKVLADVMESIPLIDSLAAAGVKTGYLAELLDADELVNGYTEELEMLFQNHGYQYSTGEIVRHDDASSVEYESDTYMAVWKDPESYSIVYDMDSYIPREDIKAMLGGLIDTFLDGSQAVSVKEDMAAGFDGQVKEDAVCNSYLYIKYFPDGWPAELVSQETVTIGGRGKLTQKYIVWDYRSIGN